MAELVQSTNNDHNFLNYIENMLSVCSYVLLSDVCRVISSRKGCKSIDILSENEGITTWLPYTTAFLGG